MKLEDKVTKLVIGLLLISNITYAADIKTIYLPQGSPAPFAGYLETPDTAAASTNLANEVKTYKLLNTSLQTSLDNETKARQNSDAANAILQGDLTNTQKALNEVKATSTWEKIGWFSLGVLATGLAVDGAYKLSQIK